MRKNILWLCLIFGYWFLNVEGQIATSENKASLRLGNQIFLLCAKVTILVQVTSLN